MENNVENLGFVARDGYTLLKIFNLIHHKQINTSYLYTPRIISLLAREDYMNYSPKEIQSLINVFNLPIKGADERAAVAEAMKKQNTK